RAGQHVVAPAGEHVGGRAEMRFRHGPDTPTIRSMNFEYFQQLLTAQPFVPFVVHLSNGKSYPVRYTGCAALTRTRLAIADPDADTIFVCPLLHITSVEMLHPAQQAGAVA